MVLFRITKTINMKNFYVDQAPQIEVRQDPNDINWVGQKEPWEVIILYSWDGFSLSLASFLPSMPLICDHP